MRLNLSKEKNSPAIATATKERAFANVNFRFGGQSQKIDLPVDAENFVENK